MAVSLTGSASLLRTIRRRICRHDRGRSFSAQTTWNCLARIAWTSLVDVLMLALTVGTLSSSDLRSRSGTPTSSMAAINMSPLTPPIKSPYATRIESSCGLPLYMFLKSSRNAGAPCAFSLPRRVDFLTALLDKDLFGFESLSLQSVHQPIDHQLTRTRVANRVSLALENVEKLGRRNFSHKPIDKLHIAVLVVFTGNHHIRTRNPSHDALEC